MKAKLWMAFIALFVFSAFTTDRTVTIFMIGDSTMANKSLNGGNRSVAGDMCSEAFSVKRCTWTIMP